MIVVLASASPRRLELLSRLGIEPHVLPADVDESELPGETPSQYVIRVAADKAHAALAMLREEPSVATAPIVLAADTAVILGGRPLGKPSDADGAATMLLSLRGRTHQVLTGVVAIGADGIEHSLLASASVTMANAPPQEIDWYVSTGEPLGKAGGYAIQGIGEFLVEDIEGAPSTVIGLPLRQTLELLRVAGLRWP